MPRPYRADYQPFPTAVKRAALTAAGGHCQACGRSDLPLEVDHHIPQSAGGPNTIDNAIALCTLCHHIKTRREQEVGIQAAAPARAARRDQRTRYIEPHPNAPHD